jgi:hypothetical protein
MEHTEPSQETNEEERTDAEAPHMADRAATPEEERLAEESRDRFADDAAEVAKREHEMDELGANEKGEGRIS